MMCHSMLRKNNKISLSAKLSLALIIASHVLAQNEVVFHNVQKTNNQVNLNISTRCGHGNTILTKAKGANNVND